MALSNSAHIEIPPNGILQTVARTFTAAELIAGQQIVFVPKPGPNKHIQFIQANFIVRPGTVPFVLPGPGSILICNDQNSDTAFDIATSSFLDLTVPTMSTANAKEFFDPLSLYENVDWFLSILQPPTSGNGALTIVALYYVISLG